LDVFFCSLTACKFPFEVLGYLLTSQHFYRLSHVADARKASQMVNLSLALATLRQKYISPKTCADVEASNNFRRRDADAGLV